MISGVDIGHDDNDGADDFKQCKTSGDDTADLVAAQTGARSSWDQEKVNTSQHDKKACSAQKRDVIGIFLIFSTAEPSEISIPSVPLIAFDH